MAIAYATRMKMRYRNTLASVLLGTFFSLPAFAQTPAIYPVTVDMTNANVLAWL